MKSARAVILALAFAAMAMPAAAGEKYDESFWNNLPPMTPGDKVAFDQVIRSLYRPECRCVAFIMYGEVRGFKLPLDNEQRWLIFNGVKEGRLIPLVPKGQGS